MSEKIRVLIVDDLTETRENVRKLLQFEADIDVIGQASNGQQAVEMAKEHQPDIILMDINMPGLDGIAASQMIARNVPACQIIIMSVQSEADYLRRAMLAGARDFLMKPFSGDELVAAVRRVYETRPVAAAPPLPAASEQRSAGGDQSPRSGRREGKIIVVFSPKGGSGCTTVAVNLAAAIAQQGYQTAIMDGSFQFGDVGVMLNMKSATTVIDLVERINDLDRDLISSILQSHATGLKALLAPARPEMAELITEEHMKILLKEMQQQYDFLVVDTSSTINDVSLALLDRADRIILLVQQNLPSLKNASRFYDLIQDLEFPPETVMLVANRTSSKTGISIRDISDTLKRPLAATIPTDDTVVSDAIDQGQPLVSGSWRRRPVAIALEKLAQQIIEELSKPPVAEEPAEEAAPVSRLARLFGAR